MAFVTAFQVQVDGIMENQEVLSSFEHNFFGLALWCCGPWIFNNCLGVSILHHQSEKFSGEPSFPSPEEVQSFIQVSDLTVYNMM